MARININTADDLLELVENFPHRDVIFGGAIVCVSVTMILILPFISKNSQFWTEELTRTGFRVLNIMNTKHALLTTEKKRVKIFAYLILAVTAVVLWGIS